ncbi:MAG: metalloregulator ArsR/SmtB family transcription factor [Bauldia litoralis]|uniref:ArsR/SmtB family transcription factor n=1 Tax=Bauldia litoralis TaxID=665467 RepID=UPI0032997A46
MITGTETMQERFSIDALLAALRAAGESSRLRILSLLHQAELSVKDLTAILGQSQPRISRHLKLLSDGGLVGRFPEGAWVFYRLTEGRAGRRFADELLAAADPDDPVLARDRERLAQIKQDHASEADRYFTENAGAWDKIRALHVAEDAVETAVADLIGERPFDSLLDLGTGTGRMLELLNPLYSRAIGVDASSSMLAVARANLDRAGIGNVQVRLGDIYNLPLPRDSFNLVVVHQVLHFLDDPERALAEAARVLRPGGRLLIVDFAPHDLEFLREEHAHRRLGFGRDQVGQWVQAPGLKLDQVVELPSGDDDKLKVILWLARDQRIAVAGDADREVA